MQAICSTDPLSQEWDGPLVSVSGTSITVKGATDSVLDGDGSRWWDGEGDIRKDGREEAFADTQKAPTAGKPSPSSSMPTT